MRNTKFALATAVASGLLAPVAAMAQAPGQSGSQLFQVGAEATTSAVSSTSISYTIPLSGGGSGVLYVGGPGSSISQIAPGGFSGPGTYVLTDSTGAKITVVVDAFGNIASISEGDNS